MFGLFRDPPEIVTDVRRSSQGEYVSALHSVGPLSWETHLTPVLGSDGAVGSVIGVSLEASRVDELLASRPDPAAFMRKRN